MGKDFYYPIRFAGHRETDSSINDEYGHGTHVTGIAGAESNNATGISGVCWNCKILAIQVFGKWLNPYDDKVYWVSKPQIIKNAIDSIVNFARNNPSKKVIINFSGGQYTEDPDLEAAVSYANSNNILIIAAAGNKTQGPGNPYGVVAYPAAYSLSYSNVIAVNATDHKDSLPLFAVQGNSVNLSAPGGGCFTGGVGDGESKDSLMSEFLMTFGIEGNFPCDIYSTFPPDTYKYWKGTSMSAPHVTGSAGLVYSVNPSLTASEVRNILQSTADDKGTLGWDQYYGYGRLNAYNAVRAAMTPKLSSPPNCATVSSSPVLTWSPILVATSYRLQVSTNNNFTNIVRDISGITSTSYVITGLSNTSTYYWRVNSNKSGTSSNWSQIRYFRTSPPPASYLTGSTFKTTRDGEIVGYPRLLWTISDWCDVSYMLYRYTCFQRGQECEPWDCGETGTVIYQGTETSYIDRTTMIGSNNCATVHYYVKATANIDGSSSNSNKVWYGTDLEIMKPGIAEGETKSTLPKEIQLFENYPDPFNPQTTIQYTLPEPMHVRLVVYDILGREVEVIVDNIEDAGLKSVNWEAGDVPGGIYFYRLQTYPIDGNQSRNFIGVGKMQLLR